MLDLVLCFEALGSISYRVRGPGLDLVRFSIVFDALGSIWYCVRGPWDRYRIVFEALGSISYRVRVPGLDLVLCFEVLGST